MILLLEILNVLLGYETYTFHLRSNTMYLNRSIYRLSWLVLDFTNRVDDLLRSRNKVAEIN